MFYIHLSRTEMKLLYLYPFFLCVCVGVGGLWVLVEQDESGRVLGAGGKGLVGRKSRGLMSAFLLSLVTRATV